MKFKELRKKAELYLHAAEKLQNVNIELNTTQCLLNSKKQQLEELKEKIEQAKEQLKSLKIEKVSLKDFINQNFLEDYKNYDYKINIKDCYVIGLHGKKYIAIKNGKAANTSDITIEHFTYWNTLALDDDGKMKFICSYYNAVTPLIHYKMGENLSYEEHILTLYPELSIFHDNLVPDTFLKKIYYEINNLSNNSILERARVQKQKS